VQFQILNHPPVIGRTDSIHFSFFFRTLDNAPIATKVLKAAMKLQFKTTHIGKAAV